MDTGSSAEAVVQAIAQRLTDAWRVGDGRAFAESVCPDADFINLIGMYVQGREAVAKLHQTIFDGFYKGSVMTLDTERARFLADDVIMAQTSTEVHVPAGPLQGVVRGVITMVLVRSQGVWQIASFQNTKREGSAPDQGARIVAELNRA